MNDIVLIKPKEGMTIPVPEYGFMVLPIDGMELPLNLYWQTRITEGGAEIAQPQKIEDKKKPTSKEVE